MPRGYHVIENTPGYMPESEPAHFNNKRDAQAYMAELARELRADGYHVSGNQRTGYYAERSRADLGRVIALWDCEEDACQEGE